MSGEKDRRLRSPYQQSTRLGGPSGKNAHRAGLPSHL